MQTRIAEKQQQQQQQLKPSVICIELYQQNERNTINGKYLVPGMYMLFDEFFDLTADLLSIISMFYRK